jgi:hypothetical protein
MSSSAAAAAPPSKPSKPTSAPWANGWNEDPKPFIWTKPAEQILESIGRLSDTDLRCRTLNPHEACLDRLPEISGWVIRWTPSGRQTWVAVMIWSGSSLARITTPG